MADDEVVSELAQLRRRMEQLERRLVERPQSPASPATVAATSAGKLRDGSVSRRGALRALGGAGLAVAAGAALTMGADPANAANGSPLTLGSNANGASSPTGLEVTGTDQAYGLAVTDNGLSSIPVEVFEPAILGHAQDAAFDIGVCGYNATINPGVLGYSASGTGVWGHSGGSAGSIGVLAQSAGGIGMTASGGQGALYLEVGNTTAPPLRPGHQIVGLIDCDEAGNVWQCIGMAAGNWVRLAGPNTAGALTVLAASVRVYDSRKGEKPTAIAPKKPLVAHTPRTIKLTANKSGVPATANAVLVNVTVVPIARSGFLAAYKAGIAYPGTSTVHWAAAGHPVANAATVAVSHGEIDVYASGATNVIIDVIGYYQ